MLSLRLQGGTPNHLRRLKWLRLNRLIRKMNDTVSIVGSAPRAALGSVHNADKARRPRASARGADWNTFQRVTRRVFARRAAENNRKESDHEKSIFSSNDCD
jgi:hypothetical protein